MKQILSILILWFFTLPAFSQAYNKFVRKGNEKYEQKEFQEAEIDYRKALELNERSVKGSFNLGDALYQQENYSESAKSFAEVAATHDDEKIQAGAYHNLGNSLLKEKKYAESIEAYKKALRKNPSDLDTKYNLAYAREMLKQQQQQQDQNKNQDQEKKDRQDKQQQDQQNQEKKQDQQQKNTQKEQQKQDQQQQQTKPQPMEISREEAKRMLEALKKDEKKTLEKLMKLKAKNAKSTNIEKDW